MRLKITSFKKGPSDFVTNSDIKVEKFIEELKKKKLLLLRGKWLQK